MACVYKVVRVACQLHNYAPIGVMPAGGGGEAGHGGGI